MNIHTILHVPYEGIGCINNWITKHNHLISYTKIYENAKFPEVNQFEWLLIMGGPMSVYEESENPWLIAEKEFIKTAIEDGKKVIGICLGAQLIADVLGAKVYPNNFKEIGWLDIFKTNHHDITSSFPDKTTVFQWHGDTFNIPENAVSLFKSNVCKNQAFILNNQVLALQFHYEATPETINLMLMHGASELIPSETIQTAQTIVENYSLADGNNELMYKMLDFLFVN